MKPPIFFIIIQIHGPSITISLKECDRAAGLTQFRLYLVEKIQREIEVGPVLENKRSGSASESPGHLANYRPVFFCC